MKARLGLLVLSLLLLPACSMLRGMDAGDEPAVVEDIRRDNTETGKTLAYYARTSKLAGPDLAREQEAARRALAKSRTDGNRVRYALVLAMPGATAQEEEHALEMLEPVSRNRDSELYGLALLVKASLLEQRRLNANTQNLQQKLDALLTLERNMTGRDSGATRKR
jgi:hypothetical protein